jgi:hypothetical protein
MLNSCGNHPEPRHWRLPPVQLGKLRFSQTEGLHHRLARRPARELMNCIGDVP